MDMRTNEEMLTAAEGHHIGAHVRMTPAEFRQMSEAGYVRMSGLTRKGSIAAQRLKSAQEQELFPL